jgi:hypothetical protein
VFLYSLALNVTEEDMGFSLNPIHDLSSALHTGEKIAEDGAKDFAGAMTDAAKAVSHMSPSQIGHTALDIVGMVPVVGTVANLANAGWYAAQGDWKDAAWSAAAAIPIEGDAVDAAKLGKDAVSIAEDGATAERAIKDGEGAEAAIKDAEAADKGEPTPAEPEPGAASPRGSRRTTHRRHPVWRSRRRSPRVARGRCQRVLTRSFRTHQCLPESRRRRSAAIGKTPGWRVETLGKGSHQGQGWVLRQYTENWTPHRPYDQVASGRRASWARPLLARDGRPRWKVRRHQVSPERN